MAFDLVAKLKLIDNMSGPIRKVERQYRQLERATNAYKSANQRVQDTQGRFINQNKNVESSIGGLTKKFTSFKAKAIAAGGAVAGIGAAYGAVKVAANSIEKAMSFEAQLSTIKALTGATNAEMAEMQKLALKMGANTKYNALEAAQGIEELLKAGLTPAAVKAGGLEAALNLATAGGLDLAEAAETMATSLNAFKKDGMSAATVSNILAGTANAAATSVHDISYAIASVGSVADMVGMSFRDLNAAIGIMSNDGLKNGSDAGTSFKSMLMYLQPQTKKAAQLFEALGIGVGKANKFFNKGKVKDLAGIAEVLNQSLSKFSEQSRTALMLEMFGTDGVKAATSLYKAGAKGVKDFNKEMAKVTALQVAREKMNNAAGAVEQFKGALETLQISALMPTMPIIQDLGNAAADFIEKYTPQITKVVDDMVQKVKRYMNTHYFNNPEFKKLPDLQSKVAFVFDDIMNTFNEWWDKTGKAKTTEISEKVINVLSEGIKASQPLIDAAVKVGIAVGEGLLQGIMSNPLLATLLGGYAGSKILGGLGKGGVGGAVNGLTKFGIPAAIAGGGTYLAVNGFEKADEFIRNGGFRSADVAKQRFEAMQGMKAPEWITDVEQLNPASSKYYRLDPRFSGNYKLSSTQEVLSKTSSSSKLSDKDVSNLQNYMLQSNKSDGNHAAGLDYVPWNGYRAVLHQGEAVLTKTEAAEYRERGGNGGGTFNFTINYSGSSDKRSDARELMRMMVQEIKQAEGAVAFA